MHKPKPKTNKRLLKTKMGNAYKLEVPIPFYLGVGCNMLKAH